jgi:hypothetical protein
MYSRTFCCKVDIFSIKLKRDDIKPVVDKTINRIPGW